MKILEIPVLNTDGSLNYTAELNKDEVIKLLQLGINVSASIGLGAVDKQRRKAKAEREEEYDEDDLRAGLND